VKPNNYRVLLGYASANPTYNLDGVRLRSPVKTFEFLQLFLFADRNLHPEAEMFNFDSCYLTYIGVKAGVKALLDYISVV
jgi:hypothetical protein